MWAFTLGVGLSLGWFVLAPPHAFRTAPFAVAATAVTVVAVVALAIRPLRRDVLAWLTLSMAVVWVVLAVTWMLVMPGASHGGLALVLGGGALVGLVAVVAAGLWRIRRRRADAMYGLGFVAAAIVGLIVSAGSLVDIGVRIRFDRVRHRYEQAIGEDRVEATGGFVDGDIAGWVWAGKLVLDPLSGVVFDPNDALAAESRFIAAVGEVAECTRIEPHWFFCEYS